MSTRIRSLPSPDSRPSWRVDQAGVTLVEALIVIVMVGLLGSAAVSLLRSQDRFYTRLDHGVTAEQAVRIAADLVSSELRMGAPEDVLAAEADSVSLRFDVFRGVVCETNGANAVYLFVFDSVPNPSLPTSFEGTAYSLPYVVDYEYADGWVGTTSASSAAQTACTNNGAPSGSPASMYRDMSGWVGNFPSGLPARGSIVRRYRQLTYRLGASGFGAGWGLYRGTQELVSPLDPSSTFEYVLANGTVLTSVPAGNLQDIRLIRLRTVAVDQDPRFDLTRQLDADIPLRN